MSEKIEKEKTIKIKAKVLDLLKPFQKIPTEYGEAKITLKVLLEYIIEEWHQKKLDNID